MTYLLGVGDRHLENLLLTRRGCLFHVDFAFLFGRDPEWRPLPPPMRITRSVGLLTACYTMKKGWGGRGNELISNTKTDQICWNQLRKVSFQPDNLMMWFRGSICQCDPLIRVLLYFWIGVISSCWDLKLRVFFFQKGLMAHTVKKVKYFFFNAFWWSWLSAQPAGRWSRRWEEGGAPRSGSSGSIATLPTWCSGGEKGESCAQALVLNADEWQGCHVVSKIGTQQGS